MKPSEVKAIMLGLPRMSGRSDLFQWMLANHVEFAAELGERPDWSNWALAFAKADLLARNGKPASGTVVRQTWWKVRKYAAVLGDRGIVVSDALRVKAVPERLKPKRKPRPAPSLVIPDPPVMPPDVRTLSAEPSPHPPTDATADALEALGRVRSWIPSRRGD